MKIVVNRRFGGFGLSSDAMKRLVMLGVKSVRKYTLNEYQGNRCFSEYEKGRMRAIGDGFFVGMIEDVLYKRGYVYTNDDSMRTDETLISVIEELGDGANSRHAQLEIVDIPNGINWEIDEYDGNETIHELHRSW